MNSQGTKIFKIILFTFLVSSGLFSFGAEETKDCGCQLPSKKDSSVKPANLKASIAIASKKKRNISEANLTTNNEQASASHSLTQSLQETLNSKSQNDDQKEETIYNLLTVNKTQWNPSNLDVNSALIILNSINFGMKINPSDEYNELFMSYYSEHPKIFQMAISKMDSTSAKDFNLMVKFSKKGAK